MPAEYCVTGGTGFIASYLIRELLRRGHTVRATVRNPDDESKVGWLWDLHEGARERLRLVKADLTVDGSFDQAVDGVDGVFHTASPVLVPYDEHVQDNLINPCINGTANVLRSCAKSPSIKRVVLTSSCSSIRYRDDATQASPLNGTHWSDPGYCRRHNLWYAYAKTLGEKEAWRLASELPASFDLAVVNPSFVVGPLISPLPTSTLKLVLGILNGQVPAYPNTTIGFVHIDDVVAAHVLAMEEPRAGGCRLVCSAEVESWKGVVDMLKAKYPDYPITDKCDDREGDNFPHSMDSSEIRSLGLPEFKSLTQMFDDCIRSFHERGWLPGTEPSGSNGSNCVKLPTVL